ncbi:uncharacterized protein P884DRAFT_100060 [Thermothelomyces heterothallicus CBS 202.75]|uniref:uncharacterized protein n=1 Tax=Thermothelomyces heterothallicus CBS 202.75 TaxID=1149848 RepID=UPI0037422B2F
MVASMSFPAPFLVHHSLPVVVMAVILVWAALVLVPRWRRTDPASMCLRSSAALFSSVALSIVDLLPAPACFCLVSLLCI